MLLILKAPNNRLITYLWLGCSHLEWLWCLPDCMQEYVISAYRDSGFISFSILNAKSRLGQCVLYSSIADLRSEKLPNFCPKEIMFMSFQFLYMFKHNKKNYLSKSLENSKTTYVCTLWKPHDLWCIQNNVTLNHENAWLVTWA